jgi:hypothetical protein
MTTKLNKDAETILRKEFGRQVENLLKKGYPKIASVRAENFTGYIEPLKERIGELATLEQDLKAGRIPFVIVIKNDLVATAAAMPRVIIKGQKGTVGMHPIEPKSFEPIEGLQIPTGLVYLVVDIDTGRETLNVTPHEALKKLQQENRSPLTIDEGVALVTHFPEVLKDKKNYNCFSMLGSRRSDQRVPALWISSKKPRLGWCWDNNPHTWLGSASCGSRVGSVT